MRTGGPGGRVPSRRELVAIWLVAALALAGLIVAGRMLRLPGDDPDPGRQRPGILDLGPLPEPAPSLPGLAVPRGRRTVVFFVTGDRLADLCTALSREDDLDGERVVVVSESSGRCPQHVTVVATDVRAAASAYGLPRPRGARTPTGYAIVDATGRVRYRTLDPVAASLLDEVATMLRGLR